jgi:transposase InsO family protein
MTTDALVRELETGGEGGGPEFLRYWRSISKPGPGRPPLSKEVQEPIVRMATESCWRARKIQAELVKLGIRVYVWFAIDHGRRRILHFTITTNLTARWVIPQLREAFPEEPTHRFLVHDNDTIFSAAVTQAIANFQISPKWTALRSPWQNGTAERFGGSVRRELLDDMVLLNEEHLRRLLREYLDTYNAERVRTSLRDAQVSRPVEGRPSPGANVVGFSRVGGLHHRYAWRETP